MRDEGPGGAFGLVGCWLVKWSKPLAVYRHEPWLMMADLMQVKWQAGGD